MRFLLSLLPLGPVWRCRVHKALWGKGHDFDSDHCDPPACVWCGRTRRLQGRT